MSVKRKVVRNDKKYTVKELKEMFLKSLDKNKNTLTLALSETHISYQTYKKWINTDEQFKKDCSYINEKSIDYVESKLMNLIDNENVVATLFYLKCRRPEKWNDKSNQINVNITNTEFQIGNSNEFKQLEDGIKIIDMNEEQD